MEKNVADFVNECAKKLGKNQSDLFIRDRYFAKHNLKIFHYTGKEIINKPLEVAAEILKEILGYSCLGV